ncbi:MAG: hypothetical protein GY799_32530 [Desulfobulbaceae bacterium]|nr:hypothetical protein [Desulfobulbaceae bacterium]
MSRFFPMEHGEDFLSDADFVPLEAAGDDEIPEFRIPVAEDFGFDAQPPRPPANAVPPAPDVRRSTRQLKAPDRLGIRKK